MTQKGQESSAIWKDQEFAGSWVAADAQSDHLDLPRRIAAALVAHDRPAPRLVVDVASGPGAFLAAFLDELPDARGVWSDASEVMLAEARRRLARFGDRVEYRMGDMTALDAIGLPRDVDVITTSRAAHHLDRSALISFYEAASAFLAPGGWLINLDHTGPEDRWDRRFRSVRPQFNQRSSKEPSHHHNYPLPSIEDHLDGYRAAGITDVEIAWKAFFTCLFVGRTGG